MGVEPIEVPVHWDAPGTRPSDSPGKAESGRMPEPEVRDLVEERALAQPLGDLDGPDVRRLGQDLAGGEPLGAVVLGVVEGVGPHRQRARHVEGLVGGDHIVGQGRREGDQLEDRSGLVDLGDGAVRRCLLDPRRQGVRAREQGGPRLRLGLPGCGATVGLVSARRRSSRARSRGRPWPGCRRSSRP